MRLRLIQTGNVSKVANVFPSLRFGLALEGCRSQLRAVQPCASGGGFSTYLSGSDP